MTLKELLHQIPVLKVWGNVDQAITDVTEDSRLVRPGSVFVAIAGAQQDGLRFVPQAVAQGAVAVVSEQPIPELAPVGAQVRDARAALAELAASFFDAPTSKLKLFGVTGTNGKTSVAHLVQHVLQREMGPSAVIGTIGWRLGMQPHEPLEHTTPSSTRLQRLFAELVRAGAKSVAMEVSSHAIHQQRVSAMHFDAGLLTNLSRDHQDYHGDFDSYAETKAGWMHTFLAQGERPRAAYNIDDENVRRIASRHPGPYLTFGSSPRAGVRICSSRQSIHGNHIQLDWGKGPVALQLPLPGAFQVSNAAAAVAALKMLGVDLRRAVAHLHDVAPVPGRFEVVDPGGRPTVIVDYAHTPEALDRLLRTCRELAPGRLWVIFGCGGDRDVGKRPLMAKTVEAWADQLILTSDNPRSEDPVTILQDMKRGLREDRPATEIVDRREAIAYAIEKADPDDLVVIAGKGHEAYQIIGTERRHFDDREEARHRLAGRPIPKEPS